MKFYGGMGLGSTTIRLNSGGGLVYDPEPGFLKKIL